MKKSLMAFLAFIILTGGAFAEPVLESVTLYLGTPVDVDYAGTGAANQRSVYGAAATTTAWTTALSMDITPYIPYKNTYGANAYKTVRSILVDLNLEAVAVSGTPKIFWRLEVKNGSASSYNIINSNIVITASNDNLTFGGTNLTTNTTDIADGTYTAAEYAALAQTALQTTTGCTTGTITYDPTTRKFSYASNEVSNSLYIDFSASDGATNLGFIADGSHTTTTGTTTVSSTYEVPAQYKSLTTTSASLTVDGYIPVGRNTVNQVPLNMRITFISDTASVSKFRILPDSFITIKHDASNLQY